MFRNQYDNDVTVWSPQGRIHQVEYAMEAVKQGSATVGVKSRTHAVIVALKRSANDLTFHQKKIVKLDTHAGISIAGLLSDGRIMARFMESECIGWRWMHDEPIPMVELLSTVENKLQVNTQVYGRRPWGVGLLIAAYDDHGPHIIQTCPSGMVYECHSMAIGGRSQSARTHLERNMNDFANCTLDQLIHHALVSLRDTLPNEMTLTKQNTTVAVVGEGTNFKICEDDEVEPYLASVSQEPRAAQGVDGDLDQDEDMEESVTASS